MTDKENAQLYGELEQFVDAKTLVDLQEKQPYLHFMIAARQVLLMALCVLGILYFKALWYCWLPLSLVLGCLILVFRYFYMK